MNPTVLASYLNGVAAESIPISHRAIAYGDGVFETMRSVAGAIPLWPWHQRRLADSLSRLNLAAPDWQELSAHLQTWAQLFPHHVIKLMVTAAAIPRGYRRTSTAIDTLAVISELPMSRSALRVAISDVQLAIQPRTAGLKHLNRLEQVLAASQMPSNCDEVLMMSTDQRVICASSANLFVELNGKLITPAITDCGVAGVLRAVLIERLSVSCETIRSADLSQATAMFLTNAVRGITEIATLQLDETPLEFSKNNLKQTTAAVYARQTLAEVGFPA
jgi:4-amino-4-deoxychorismate lyase